jgi:hypothetical protein
MPEIFDIMCSSTIIKKFNWKRPRGFLSFLKKMIPITK